MFHLCSVVQLRVCGALLSLGGARQQQRGEEREGDDGDGKPQRVGDAVDERAGGIGLSAVTEQPSNDARLAALDESDHGGRSGSWVVAGGDPGAEWDEYGQADRAAELPGHRRDGGADPDAFCVGARDRDGRSNPVAQQMFDKQGLYDEIDVSARPGISSQQLVRAIAPLLPATAEVKTAANQVQETTKHVEEGMAIVRYVLLAFGAIALFVGAFVIFNTLSVTVAQRKRELATLRTLGASRRQVLD
jgi:hypothetical protein